MRKDWLKKKFEANLSFTEWLQKKGKRRWARKYQEYIDGKNVNQQKPHWIKNMWNEWQEEGGIDKMFNENKAKGVVAFKSKYVYELEDQISEKNPNIAAEIEKVIRDQASAISKELEGNPSPNEKISEEKEDK